MNGRSLLAPKDESVLAVTDETPKKSGHGGMQVDLPFSVLSLRCLPATFPDGLLYRQSVTHKMFYLETENLTCAEARRREQGEGKSARPLGFYAQRGNFITRKHRGCADFRP